MTIYQTSCRDECEEHKGYCYYDTRRAALQAKREAEAKGFEITIIKFTARVTKRGLLKALNRYGSHPDNG